MAPALPSHTARTKILGSALAVIRAKGYAATSVDDLCAAAGVTKGAFFHHFKSKEDLAVAAADFWSETTAALFAGAPYHAHRRSAAARARLHRFPQERSWSAASPSSPASPARWCRRRTRPIRPSAMLAPAPSSSTPRRLEADIAAGDRAARHDAAMDAPSSLALHTQAVLQGAFILAKAKGGAQVAADSPSITCAATWNCCSSNPSIKEDAA